MAEIFATVSATVSIIDISYRLGLYINTVVENTKNLEKELDSLQAEIERFTKMFEALKMLCAKQHQPERKAASRNEDPCSSLWTQATRIILDGEGLLARCEVIFRKIVGKESLTTIPKINDVLCAIKLSLKDSEYRKLRAQLSQLNSELNIVLSGLNL